ncbi:hypothetical protein K5Y32_22020 [Pantoea sp. DY-15]|uniref:hypothetical protein n=1 Tax=Pantoea sp. DY-15 TaxID=2871489 RepID=UPI001C93CB81|nr:hypothetical protein [Pantoea sp. DY-15]MBY4890619.1 hypothetical protein [Pantoea sp. DY-15]
MNKETSTRWINKALSVLFFNYPVRSAVGFIFGTLIWLGFGVYPILFEVLRAPNNYNTRTFFALMGYLVIHTKTFIEAVSGNILSENIKQTLHLIDIADVPDVQKRMMYAAAISKQIKMLDKSSLEANKNEITED